MEEGKRCKQDRSSRRRALEEELAKILAQKAAVEERVAQLRKRAQAAAVDKEAQPSQVEVAREANSSKHKQFPKEKSLHQLSNGGLASGSKRPFPEQAQQPPRLLPGSVHEEYNSKKQEIETGRQRRMHNIWNHCVSILRSLKKMSGSHPFLKPVDPVALNIPDYFDIIKKPMDLGTIEKKLAHNPSKNQYREYDDPLQFRDDVRLVFNNCRTYNQPQHEVTKLGEKLSEAFEKKWATSNVEGLIAQDKAFRTREDLTLAELEASLSGNQSTDCAQKLRKISEELKAELSGKAAVSTGVENGASGKMTFEQKRLLSIALGSLPGDKLYRVLEIVSESNGISPEDEEEVELDIDSLDDRTLRKLQDYVNSVASAQMGGQRTTSKSAAAVQSKDTAPASHHEHQTTGGKAPAAAHPQEEHRVAPSADGKGSDSGYSSSSSDDSSSSSGSDSKGEEQRGSTLNGEGAATGGAGFDKGGRGGDMGMEASALVSATRPSAPPQRSIVKTHASSKKGVNLQNAGAWESLTQGEQGDNEERADGLQGQEVDKAREPPVPLSPPLPLLQ